MISRVLIRKSPDEVEKEHQNILRNKVCLVQVNWWILSTPSRLSSQTSPTTCACPCPTLTVQHCSMWPMDWPRPVEYQVGIWIIFICNGNIAEATSNIELILFPVPVSSLAPMIPVPVVTPACNIKYRQQRSKATAASSWSYEIAATMQYGDGLGSSLEGRRSTVISWHKEDKDCSIQSFLTENFVNSSPV